MKRINVTTVQQYTINRLRISLNGSYETELLEKLSFKLFKEDGEEVTSRLKSIKESNGEEWQYILDTQTIDVYLKENTQLEDGNYTFVLIRDNQEIYRGMFPLSHMEDIRVEFDKVKADDMQTLHVSLKSINGNFQSLDMMKILKFSIIDESGVQHNDAFQTLLEYIESSGETEIKEFILKLKPGKTLPEGYYDVRLTSIYKSRTFPIVEKYTVRLPFMTTQPAKITSVQIAKQSVTQQTVLSIIFNPFLEKGQMLKATREIIRERDKKDITKFFDATRLSTISYSVAGVQYITRLEIPLVENMYSLEKGKYTVKFTWDEKDETNKIIPPVEYTFEVGWVVTNLDNIEVFEGKFVDFDLPKAHFTEDFLRDYELLVELNGKEIDTTGIFGPLEEVAAMKTGETPNRSDHFGVRILNMEKIQDGNYSFLLWTTRVADNNGFEGDIYYNYLGNIDIVDYLTPEIEDVYQSNVDAITVVLKKPQPISSLIQCNLTLFDQYNRIDFSDRLIDIENSNIWEPGQVMADRFNIVIRDDKTLTSGRYQFRLNFRGKESEPYIADISHIESRRGYIEKIEQISINRIKITFSEPQSRQFLLTTKFRVLRWVSDDETYYQDRFEYLENVLKADQASFKEFEIMMDHEDSLPAGRYEISFVFENEGHKLSTEVYSYRVELGFMTNNIPSINYINTSYSDNGELMLNINFKNNLEMELYNTSIFSCIRKSDGLDIESDFEDKESWTYVTTKRQNIYFIKSLSIPAKDVDYAHIERGVYTVVFSWNGIIPFMEDIEKDTFLEYYLPLLKLAEVVDMDMVRKWARIYFELPVTMQYEYFETLKVEVIGPSGEDVTDLFDTVFNSNKIDPSLPSSDKLPSNSFNLDVLEADQLKIGKYQFIFYTDYSGIRRSEWMYKLDVRQAIRPEIAFAEQCSMSQIEITLKEAIPRRLLEELDFYFWNVNHTDHSDDFLTIDTSNGDNEMKEDVREVTKFILELKEGAIIPKGTYQFAIYNKNFLCDEYILDIIWMEGGYGSLDTIRPKRINLLGFKFKNEESKELFSTLGIVIEDMDGQEYNNRFDALESGVANIDTDYFCDLELPVLKPIPDGIYNIRFERTYGVNTDSLPDNENIHIPFMSNVIPYMKTVTLTKLGETMAGDDAMIIEFAPPLEKTIYDDAKFGILNASNLDIDVTNRFKDLHESGIVDITVDQYGIEYVHFVTLEFANMTTLNRDRYRVRFEWAPYTEDGIHGYMTPLQQERTFDYIMFPLLSVEQLDMETVRLTFKHPVSPEDMRRSEVEVFTDRTEMTADGPVYTEVNFSNEFLSMQTTNTFVDGQKVPFIDVKMGTRDPEHPAHKVLPPDNYRFVIVQPPEEDEYGLQYRYSGIGYLNFLINHESLYCNSSVIQTSYDRLRYTWDMLQFTRLLDTFTFSIKRENPEKKGEYKDYSDLFLDTHSANYYYHLKNDDEYEEGYYENSEEYDLVIDEVHYTLQQTLKAYAKLRNGCALPAHTYDVGFVYNKKEYFKQTISLPFMTSTPPQISNMYFDCTDDEDEYWLVVQFRPYAEYESLKISSFNIMTYLGEYADGTIRGKDKTRNFGQVSNSEIIELEDPKSEIRYVKEIHVPVIPGSIMPSGRYRLTWKWPASSFFPDSIYYGGLKLIGFGVESARVITQDTIEVVLEKEMLAADFKELDLNVVGISYGDISERFMELKESNKDIKDDARTKTYYLKLDEGEEILGGTYRFTLSQVVEEEDDDDEETSFVKLSTCVWEMTLVYLTTDFPNLERLDNLSIEKYTVVELTNENASTLVGKEIQLITSNNPKEIIRLTNANVSDFIDKTVRVYGEPAIDCLTAKLDDEVDTAFINALEVAAHDEDGNSIVESFQSPGNSNNIKARDILYGIKVRLNKYDTCENIKKYDFYIQTADGRDITKYFNTIEDSNNFTSDESKTKDFYIKLSKDYTIENYELPGLIVRLEDASDKVISKFKHEIQMQTIKTVNMIDMLLASKTTVCSGRYTFKFTYTNDPDNEKAVWLNPFNYTGNIPFLSNNLGSITNVNVIDFEHIDLEFSELSLPVKAFLSFELRLINEDNDEMEDVFEDLITTNIFDGAETLAELDEPGILHLQLKEGVTIPSGTYRFQFWIEISANETNAGNGAEAASNAATTTNNDENNNVHTGEYCLWDRYTGLPVMFREMSNTIKSVEIIDINRVKVNLEKSMDISILKSFVVDLYNPLKDITLKDKFDSVEDSNFFGMYLMTTDKSNILYSKDGNYWEYMDTDFDYSYNKCFYHKPSQLYFAITGNGKIIRFKSPDKYYEFDNGKPAEEVNYMEKQVRTSFNDCILLNDETLLVVGNNGTLLKGKIDSSGNIQLTDKNPGDKITKNTLKSIAYYNKTLLVVGRKGTVLKSTDDGETWVVIPTGVRFNLNDVIYHSNKIKVEGEIPEVEVDDTSDTPLPEPKIEEIIDMSAWFICGANGTIMTCSDFKEGFTKLDTDTHKELFSIISHGDDVIAVGDTGTIINVTDSEDGHIVSNVEVPDCSFALKDIEYYNGRYFVCGANGSWLSSKEGTNWTINYSFSAGGTRSVTYIPSQYDAEKANWFYLNVAENQEIAYINYYSGWDVPTLESEFCADWKDNATKDEHIQDFYTRFEFEDHRPKPKEFYHFVKSAKMVPMKEEDEDGIERTYIDLENISYKWEKCPGYESAHNGLFYIRLRDKNRDNENDWMYGTSEAIQLPYLTSKSLEIKNVTLHSPDDHQSVEVYKPYLHIEMDDINENYFHYVRYEFIRTEDNVDCTNWFQSIRTADFMYNKHFGLNGLMLYGNPEKNITDIKKGTYKLRWTWMAPGTAPDNEKYRIINKIPVKNMVPLVKSFVIDNKNPDTITIQFTKPIDSNFFYVANDFSLSIRKVPTTREEYEKYKENEYYSLFELIEKSTVFEEVDHVIQTDKDGHQILCVNEVKLKLKDSNMLSPGNYLFKINNTSGAYKKVKETDDTIWVTCVDDRGLELLDELTSNLPKIRSVDLARYTPIPIREDGGYSETHSGKGINPGKTLLNNWIREGVIENHLADKYIETGTNTTYYLKKDEIGYVWWTSSEDPYLCISFDGMNMPLYSTFLKRYKAWLLDEMEKSGTGGDGSNTGGNNNGDGDNEPTTPPVIRPGEIVGGGDDDEKEDNEPQTSIQDLRPWFRQELKYFEYEFSIISDVFGNKNKYISKLYIPFVPDCDDFPGCSNGTYVLQFDPAGIYRDCELRHIVLPGCMKEYGDIGYVTPKNPSISKDDPTAGFIIKLKKLLPKRIIQSMEVSVTRILTDEEKRLLKPLPANFDKLSEEEKKKFKEGDSNEVDVTDKFMSVSYSNEDDINDSTIDSMSQFNLWLKDNTFIDHGTYMIKLSAKVESNVIWELDGEKTWEATYNVDTPWLSTDIPKDITAKLTINGTTNPVLVITFADTKPPESSIIYSRTSNAHNGKITVKHHKSDKDYSSSFRKFRNSTVKFIYDKDLIKERKDYSIEKWVSKIKIPMANNSALPKGTYDVTLSYHDQALLEDIPDKEKYGITQFKTSQVIISKVGAINTVKCLDSRRCKITIKKNKEINTNSKLAKSRVGQVLNVLSWAGLMGKLKLKMITNVSKKEFQGRFQTSSANTIITDKSMTYKIRPNYLLNPYVYKFSYVKGECTPIAPRLRQFQGLIWNKIGKAANDPRVWILLEKEPSGKENCRVYKSYKAFLARKKRIILLNSMIKYKYKLCKQCRKIKLLSTNKISGCINTYDIPYEHKQGIAKFFKELVKKWYKMRSKKVKITLAKGKKFNKKGKIIEDTKNPDKKHTYHCSTVPFSGFKFEQRTEGKGEERQVSYSCANYVAKTTEWEYEQRIATVKPGQIPKDRSKIYFGMIVYQPPGSDDPFYFKRGYKSTKKGKKSTAFKKYIKSLKNTIKKMKENCQRCTKCKKKELAEKNNKKIGWGAARFPVQVMTKKSMKTLPSLLNVAESKGGFKCKKKTKKGCKNPKFVWTKVTIKKKAYAKLKCKNGKDTPKVLKLGAGYQGIYYAAKSSKKQIKVFDVIEPVDEINPGEGRPLGEISREENNGEVRPGEISRN